MQPWAKGGRGGVNRCERDHVRAGAGERVRCVNATTGEREGCELGVNV